MFLLLELEAAGSSGCFGIILGEPLRCRAWLCVLAVFLGPFKSYYENRTDFESRDISMNPLHNLTDQL